MPLGLPRIWDEYFPGGGGGFNPPDWQGHGAGYMGPGGYEGPVIALPGIPSVGVPYVASSASVVPVEVVPVPFPSGPGPDGISEPVSISFLDRLRTDENLQLIAGGFALAFLFLIFSKRG